MPADRSAPSVAASTSPVAEIRPFDEEGAVAAARWFRDHGITTIGVCLLHSYANDEHELRMREILRREHPEAIVSISSEVLREYREYERSMTTLVDAAVKPNVSRYVTNIPARLVAFTGATEGGRAIPFYVMKSNGGVLSADEVVHQPITTVLSGPAAGALGAALIASRCRLPQDAHLRRRRHVDRRLRGARRRAHPHHRGHRRRLPEQDPDDRRRHRRRRRRLDRLALAGGHPQGRPALGRRRPRPALLRQGRHRADHHRRPRHARPDPTPPARRRDPARRRAARAGIADLAAQLGLDFETCATGILEISAWNQANALRQVSVKRGLDVRDFMLTTFGGSGSLLACRLVDILDLAGVVVPPNPGNVSAFGLLTVDVKNDYVQTHVAKESALDRGAVQAILDDLTDQAAQALAKEGFAAPSHRSSRTIDLRYVGQAFEVRVAAPEGDVDGRTSRGRRRLPRRAPPALRLRLPRRPAPAGRVGQPPRHRHRSDHPSRAPRDRRLPHGDERRRPRPPGTRPVCFDADAGYVDTPVFWRADLGPATPSPAPPSWRSSAPPSPSTPASWSASTTWPTSSSPRR